MNNRISKTLLALFLTPFLFILMISLAFLILVLPIVVLIEPKIISLPESDKE